MRSWHPSGNFWSIPVRCSRWASRNTWRLFLIPCCSAMRQSLKLLADGDDRMSLIGATASTWAKVKICRMECVTLNTSVTRSLAIIAPRSRCLIWRHARWILELCAGFCFDGPVLVTFLGRRLVTSFTHRVNSSTESAHGRVLSHARLKWARQESFIKSHFFLSTISLLLECARIGRRGWITGRSAVRVSWSRWLSPWWAVWMWNSKPWAVCSLRSWGSWLLSACTKISSSRAAWANCGLRCSCEHASFNVACPPSNLALRVESNFLEA